jgi:hypothetical protein
MFFGKQKFPQDLQDSFAVLILTDTLTKILFMFGSLYLVYSIHSMLNEIEDIAEVVDAKEKKETIFKNTSEKSKAN